MHTKLIPGYSNNPKNLIARTSYISLSILSCTFRLAQFLFVVLFCISTVTMAEANGIRGFTKEGIQSILEGYSVNDSNRSLPQVPNETLGLSSIRQNLSSSFNRLQKGIMDRIDKHTGQPQNQTPMEVDAKQISPTSLRTQLTAYQSTVRTLHEQNDRNAELLDV